MDNNNNNSRNSNRAGNNPPETICYLLDDDLSTYPLTLRRRDQRPEQNVEIIYSHDPQLSNRQTPQLSYQQPAEVRQAAQGVIMQNLNMEYYSRPPVLRQPVANLFTGRSPPQSAVYYRPNLTLGRQNQQPQQQHPTAAAALNLTTPANGFSTLPTNDIGFGVPVRPIPHHIRPNPVSNNGSTNQGFHTYPQPSNQSCTHNFTTHEYPRGIWMQKRESNRHGGHSSCGSGNAPNFPSYENLLLQQRRQNAFAAATTHPGGGNGVRTVHETTAHGSFGGGNRADVRQTRWPQSSNNTWNIPTLQPLGSFGQLHFPPSSVTVRPRYPSSTIVSYAAPPASNNPNGLMNIEEIDLTAGDHENAAMTMRNSNHPTTSRTFSISSQRPRQEGNGNDADRDESDLDDLEDGSAAGDDDGNDGERKERLRIRFSQSFKEGSDGKLKGQDLTVTVSSTGENQLPEHLGEVVTSSISHYLETNSTLLRQNIEANQPSISGFGGSPGSRRVEGGGPNSTIAEVGSIRRRPDTPDPAAPAPTPNNNRRLGRFAVTQFSSQEEAEASRRLFSNVLHSVHTIDVPFSYVPPPHFLPSGSSTEGPLPKRQKVENKCTVCGGVRRSGQNQPEAAVGGEQEAAIRRGRILGYEERLIPHDQILNIDGDSDADLPVDNLSEEEEELENIFHQFGVGAAKNPKGSNNANEHDGK
ncbi:hypothetical protein Ocin01_09660 [Orchesella cincta]|uniref:Uncharacterized protein n=1 Tax=Orchesella cincta TaxID=48709 RepID=A0A1D2MV95_ORCCI|nr:hypothetical protein Ocin01_09660 [Orchesella cincta]